MPIYFLAGRPEPGPDHCQPQQSGAPLVFLATATEGDWVQVYLPERPNEAQGWVPAADVSITSNPYRITVSLGARQLTLTNAGAVAFPDLSGPG